MSKKKLRVTVEIDQGVFHDPLVEAEDAAILIVQALRQHNAFIRAAHIRLRISLLGDEPTVEVKR